MVTKLLATTAALMLVAGPASAQHAGSVEIGLVAKEVRLDGSFSPSGKAPWVWGASVRLGLFLNRHWELEADDAQTFGHATGFFNGYASTPLNYYPHHLRVNYNQALGAAGRFVWLLGAGPAYNLYGPKGQEEPGFKGHDWGFAVLTGLRVGLTPGIRFRFDGGLDYIPSPNNGKTAVVNQFDGITAAAPPKHNIDLGLQAGLAVLLGHGH